MAIKLTRAVRDEIYDRAMRHRFDADKAAVEKMHAQIGDRIYNDLYDAKTRKLMDSLPAGFLQTQGTVGAIISGRHRRLPTSGPRRVPNDDRDFKRQYDGAHPIAEAYAEYEAAKRKLGEEKEGAHVTLWGILRSFTTTEKLLEHYPDLKPFVPEPAAVPARQLPALPAADLNTMLKLPVRRRRAKAVQP